MNWKIFGLISLILLTGTMIYTGIVIYLHRYDIYVTSAGIPFETPSSYEDLRGMDSGFIHKIIGYVEAYESVNDPIQVSNRYSSLHNWADSMYQKYEHSPIFLRAGDKYYFIILWRDWDFDSSLPLLPIIFSVFILWAVFIYHVVKKEDQTVTLYNRTS